MTWDCRRPSLIQEELSDLNDLIREKQHLMEKYPERFSLKMGLENLKNREKCLLLELKRSYERYQIDTFDFIFDGDVVNKYRISLHFIGKFAYKFQDLVTSISQSISNPSVSNHSAPKREMSKEIWDKSQLN